MRWIAHDFTRAGIQDGEATVRRDGEFDVVTGIVSLEVGDVFCLGVVVARFLGTMQLPEGLEAGNLADSLDGGLGATLLRAVVHDGDTWVNAVDERRAVALLESVVRDDEDVDFAKAIRRTHELHFLVPREVAEVENAGFVEREHDAKGACIFGLVGLARFRGCAIGVRLAGARQWLADHVAIRGYNFNRYAFDRQFVAGLRGDVLILRGGKNFLIGLITVFGNGVVRFAVRAVIDEGSDGNAIDELGNASGVIVVIVGEEDVVDALEARTFGGGDNAIGVAAAVAGPTSVDKQGFAFRRDEQSGLAAFDVDEVDAEVGGALGEQGSGARDESKEKGDAFHGE